MSSLPRRPEPAVLVDVATSVAVAALTVWWWPQFWPGAVAYGVLAGAALLWRRHRPVTVLAVVTVLSGAVAPIEVDGTRLHDGMLLVVLAVASHAVLAHSTSLRTGAGCAVAALCVAAVLMAVRSSPVQGGTVPSPAGFWHALVDLLLMPYAAVIWAAALYLRQQRASAAERRAYAERERAQHARVAVAEERARIARELHDIVAHSLSVIVLQARGGEYAFDHDPARARDALRTIGATGADALDEIRHLVEVLRADSDGDAGRHHAVAFAVERARAAGVTVDLSLDGAPPETPGGVGLAVYRIVQESLTNTLKHAGPAPSATVRVAYRPDAVELEITDTGGRRTPSRSGGHGMVGMRERATLYGGTFDAGPVPGGGWRVRARIPFTQEAVTA